MKKIRPTRFGLYALGLIQLIGACLLIAYCPGYVTWSVFGVILIFSIYVMALSLLDLHREFKNKWDLNQIEINEKREQYYRTKEIRPKSTKTPTEDLQ